MLWLSSIQAYGDSETQKTRWLKPNERNPHFSFVECMCSYFDDAYLGEDGAYEKQLGAEKVSAEEVSAVAEFHSIAASYESPSGDDYDTRAILQDPNWQEVVDAAQRAQKQLLALLTDSSERDALTRPLDWREDDGSFHADLVGSRIVPAGRWVSERRGNGWLRKLLGRTRC